MPLAGRRVAVSADGDGPLTQATSRAGALGWGFHLREGTQQCTHSIFRPDAAIGRFGLSPKRAKVSGKQWRTRQADQTGDKAACERALEKVERTIGP